MNEYVSASRLLTPVFTRGKAFDANIDPAATPLAREIAYGVLREYFLLDHIYRQLVKKPLASKHDDIRAMLLAGLYSVKNVRRPAHASVNACVEATTAIDKPWAKGLVNGVLRNFIRDAERLLANASKDPAAASGHPPWLEAMIRRQWGAQAMDVFAANNEQAPMTLRVNRLRTDRERYLSLLDEHDLPARPGEIGSDSVYLHSPVSVERLPGFREGLVSVQDEASQLAAEIVSAEPGERILDACAAPGGKTCHILERSPGAHVTALDIDAGRLDQLAQNLGRLGLQCETVVADLLKWQADPGSFDRILLDAPCSATGVIRRHPDIKLLRRETDIDKLALAQRALLRAAWRLLREGGVLVYSTCSILEAENDEVIDFFVDRTPDANIEAIDGDFGLTTRHGRQLLPTRGHHDGFYYARLHRGAAP